MKHAALSQENLGFKQDEGHEKLETLREWRLVDQDPQAIRALPNYE